MVANRINQATPLAERAASRLSMASSFVDAYRRFCWPTSGLGGLRLAPFQVLASEGRVRALDPHPWHMAIADRLAAEAPDTFRATRTIAVDLDDPASEAAAIAWWEDLTAGGGEGMVVKPVDVVVPFKRSIVQPGIKCRGPEYLRIIYGAEYTSPDQLSRLRERGLGHKRSLAIREFCLGIEALERFVRNEPLHRVHECVFGVLALESEPVDPRL
jgi:protein phosphatase